MTTFIKDPTIHENLSLPEKRKHKVYKFIYITSGNCELTFLGENMSILSPSCFCLSEKENIEIINSKRLKLTQLEFHPAYINSLFNFQNIDPHNKTLLPSAELDKYYLRPFTERDNYYKGFFIPDPSENLVLHKNIQSFITESNDTRSPFLPCRKRSSFLNLLLFICNNYRKYEINKTRQLTLVEKVISYLTNNYQDKIIIADLCQKFETNRNTLSKLFKSETGSTVMDNLASIRIQMSIILLKETTLPVSDILYRVGFNDTAHFGRTFKKISGITPSEYRKKLNA